MTTSSVYASLGLSRNPFPPTPDAGSYFFTPRLEEDFAEVAHCIQAHKGFVLLTGEVGLGKSTMVRRLLDTLEGKKCNSALILNTFLQDTALLSAIQEDFGLTPGETLEQGIARLTEFLIARHQAGETNLLVIDDAQNLTVQSLELVRLLCNLETGQEKLLQILLVGQPELEQTLAAPELRQLKSRIVKHARLNGLRSDEVARYFDFRVNAAGAEGRLSIEPAAVDMVYRATGGNLRQIHLVLDRCLYGLAGVRSALVTAELVRRAVADLPALGDDGVARVEATRPRRRTAWIAAGLLAGTAATLAVAGWSLVPHRGADAPASRASATVSASPALLPSDVATAAPLAEGKPSGVLPEGLPSARGQSAPAPDAARVRCEDQLKATALPGDVLQVQRLPATLARSPVASAGRSCPFASGQEHWLAWLSPGDARHILVAQDATRVVQGRLKRLGLLDVRELDDGLFGPKTGEALSRFQQQQGLAPTGKPDELTFLLLEHLDVSAR